MSKSNTRTLLIDHMSLFYRSLFALQRTGMMNKAGIEVFGIYGYLKALLFEISTYQPDVVIICGEGASLNRKKDFADYKVHRTSDTIAPHFGQLNLLRSVISELGIPFISLNGYEADDMINFAVQDGYSLNDELVQDSHYRVVTTDRDLLQLVSNRCEVQIYRSTSDTILYKSEEDVIKAFGVTSDRIADYKSLVGDSSDNIPGLKGFGPKATLQFLEVYADYLAGFEDDFSKIKSEKKKELLRQNADIVKMSKKLATLDKPEGLRISLTSAEESYPSIAIYDLEFKTLQSQLEILCMNRKSVMIIGEQNV